MHMLDKSLHCPILKTRVSINMRSHDLWLDAFFDKRDCLMFSISQTQLICKSQISTFAVTTYLPNKHVYLFRLLSFTLSAFLISWYYQRVQTVDPAAYWIGQGQVHRKQVHQSVLKMKPKTTDLDVWRLTEQQYAVYVWEAQVYTPLASYVWPPNGQIMNYRIT